MKQWRARSEETIKSSLYAICADELEAALREAAAPPQETLEQERTRLWDAIIAVDAIEHACNLDNSGDLNERIERIGGELAAREKIIEVYEAQLAEGEALGRVPPADEEEKP